MWTNQLRWHLRDARSVQAHAEAAIAVATERGFAFQLDMVSIQRGWALAEQGLADEGLAEMRRAMAAVEATGAAVNSDLQAQYVEALARAEAVEEALRASREALAAADKTDDGIAKAELHRLRGDLLLHQDQSNASEAERSFRAAIQVACQQQARSWELRATTSLARLLDKQGRRDEARAMLAEIYAWFIEGFDTADLKDARALLDELND